MVTTMFYHFLAPEDGHPTWEVNSTETNTRKQDPFFYATPVNSFNKSSDMLFQKVQQIHVYTRLVNTDIPKALKRDCIYNIDMLF